MNISLNIILDSIRPYRYEAHIDLPTDKTFRRILLFPGDTNSFQPDSLYVCRLTDVMRMKPQNQEIFCLCIRDRIRDERETKQLLSGTIIINENMELEQLFYEAQETFVAINEWYQNMQDAIIRNKSMQDIISMSEPILGNFISVSDSALALIAYTKNITTDDPTSRFLIENGYHSEESVKKFKKNKRFEVWMNTDGPIISTDGCISKYTIISKVFAFNETYFTHVVMTCNNREMTPGLLDLFHHLTCVLSFYIKRNWEEKKDYDHVFSSLVVELIQGKISDKEVVRDRTRIIGIKPEDEFVVMLLTGGARGKSIFPGLMAQDLTRKFSQVRAVYYNCRLMIFIHASDIRKFMAEQDILGNLNAYYLDNNISCGMSDVFKDLLELPSAYTQAELALDEGGPNELHDDIVWEPTQKWSNIAQFNTYYASCLLDKSKKIEHLWRSSQYGKMLLNLYHTDLEKNTNNLQVLYTYLVNERRATETANALHMHRNNVVYRISRIEELLGIDLEDTLTRLNLTMSFFMFKSTGIFHEYKRYSAVLSGAD